VLFRSGITLNDQNHYDRALLDFNKALEIEPKSGAAYYRRGVTELNMGNNDGACKDWNMAVQLGNKDAGGMITEHCKQ
jgi:tetratricopeptide (TPR) repeat protein